jgi:outer membrane protein OmpA-like peptidoglycan-associated protein
VLSSFFCLAQKKEKLIVYFKLNQYSLDTLSTTKLDSAFKKVFLQEVQIDAHSDSVGTDAYNDSLSLKRAGEVKKYLLSMGVDETLITMKAFGKRFPLNQNKTDAERAINRRAEIFFVVKNLPTVQTPDSLLRDTSRLNITQVEVGSSLQLENIYFEGGRHILLPGSINTLHLLLNTLIANPALEIEIQGHICCLVASGVDGADFDTGTQNLSVTRAKAVYDYLIENGIDASRLSYKGFGASKKLVNEITEQDKSTNRRVEIKIIKK